MTGLYSRSKSRNTSSKLEDMYDDTTEELYILQIYSLWNSYTACSTIRHFLHYLVTKNTNYQHFPSFLSL